jgi:tetratricopeptide (TPR) repeat protein
MPTKLSRLCDGVMEAAWLAAVILVPVFFNIYSSRIFEPDKITLLRSLVLVLLGAWLVKLMDDGGLHWDRLKPEGSKIQYILKFPMILPVVFLTIIYLLATVFSVTPWVSLLGSYQRLQGTYTTISYLVIFVALLVQLRRREQVERLITIIVLTSLPIALYGVLQRYRLDPIPWGGDTAARIASNMGNSIFVAAYLIMVFPLTIGRIIQAFQAILRDEARIWEQVSRATIYIFIASLQLIALYMSGSRGPALGWMVGCFFLFLLLSLYWNKRWLTLTVIGSAAVLGIFLLIFNLPGGPLQALKSSPAIGRFGLLLDAQSNSALVRKYIWQGAVKLVLPHAPLEFPDDRVDTFNAIRPIIGYGPESMYVAYNPFYIPELAQVERRNASPDRSHNETWDSLVITGVLGIIAYLMVFLSVIYYGLKWIGIIITRQQRALFFWLTLGMGLLAGVGFVLWRGIEYFGVGLPFGILIGLLIYITLVALIRNLDIPVSRGERLRAFTLVLLIAAIVSHFVEINFGIAIAATRTYFWTFAGMLVVIGRILPIYGEYDLSLSPVLVNASEEKNVKGTGKKNLSKKRRIKTGSSEERDGSSGGVITAILSALVIAIVLSTLGHNYLTNSSGLSSPFSIIWASITQLPNRNWATSSGVLGLILTTWVAMAVVLASENQLDKAGLPWLKSFGITLGISAGLALLYWLWHAGGLATIASNTASDLAGVLAQVNRYEWLLGKYYLYMLLLVLFSGVVISLERFTGERIFTLRGIVSAGVIGLCVLALAAYSNLRIIQADIVFKLAEPFSRSAQWPVATMIYNRANQLAPNEDYYYLFLGRAYLENAKSIQDPSEREELIRQAETDLRKAQAINPLNTDHTANLARLYSLWASYSEGATKTEKAEISSNYFSKAVKLSPNNARLWDEWALLLLNILQRPEDAMERLTRSKEIDPEYHWTYGLLGDYYAQLSRNAVDEPGKIDALQRAAENYSKAFDLPTPGEPQAKFSYALALGNTYAQLSIFQAAIDAYQRAIESAPAGAEIWRIEEVIANLYIEMGDITNALIHAQNAMSRAPDDQKNRFEQLVNQLQQSTP